MANLGWGFVLFLLFISISAHASEPAYCDPNRFHEYEQKVSIDGTKRLHVYQLGALTLAGLAIGKSDPNVLQKMAFEFGQATPEQRSCTWYLNEGNDRATQVFVHKYVPRPWFFNDRSKTVRKYVTALKSSFADDPINMVSCAIEHGYLAMGCDGMKHRGPSVFAMFLAYSGCTPENAAQIANQIWGLDTVPESYRLAIAKAGYKLGVENPAARHALQGIMLSK